jgi:Holliday junction DNA helicase RuvA
VGVFLHLHVPGKACSSSCTAARCEDGQPFSESCLASLDSCYEVRVIGRLTGRVVAEEADGAVVVDVGGVGYELLAPLGAVGRAKVDEDGRTTFFVHTHAREDALVLFGFASEVDRAAFRTLIGVSNVGPKTGLAVLSALPAGELATAIAAKDVGQLTRIPGIGKKTAERLVLELRDKLTGLPAPARTGSGPAAAKDTASASPRDVLLGALTRMGYRPAEAERAVIALGARVGTDALADLVREALAILAK